MLARGAHHKLSPGKTGAHKLIFHIDMDAFFASVEVMCRPKLKGKPVIVSGKPAARSVVAAAASPFQTSPPRDHNMVPSGAPTARPRERPATFRAIIVPRAVGGSQHQGNVFIRQLIVAIVGVNYFFRHCLG